MQGELFMEGTRTYFSFPENYDILNELSDYDEKDGYLEIAEMIIRSDKIVGSSEHFHNFAVELGKRGLYHLACDVLDRGLSIYKRSPDLLADYLCYGCDCEGNIDKCDEYYKVLRDMPSKLWTWRCYTFSLEYLDIKLEIVDEADEIKEFEAEKERLIIGYYERFPNDERPFLSHAGLYIRTDIEKAIVILEKAHNELNNCPRCSVRYADLLLDRVNTQDDFQKILGYLNSATPLKYDQEDKYGYVHYLRGVCLFKLLDEKNGDFKDQEKIEEIYRCFRIAKRDDMGLASGHLKTLKKHIHVLEEYSQISFENY